MDPTVGSTLKGVFILANTISGTVKTVKGNKRQCTRLSQRITQLTESLKNLKTISNQDEFESGLQKLESTLQQSLQFIKEYSDKWWFKKVLKSDRYNNEFDKLNVTTRP